MNLDKILSTIDPSRYTVYQMLDCFKDTLNIKVKQAEIDNLFLFKTEPCIDSLYNYAHLFSDQLVVSDLEIIEGFFQSSLYRLKTPENKIINDLLLSQGFKLKNTSYAMEVCNLNKGDYSYSLPENIKILRSDDKKNILDEAKFVFKEAFTYLSSDYDRKFGFLDQFKGDIRDDHVKTFVLYENDQPVSTGTYYAYDKFSLENIGTISSARGRGYAALILKALLQEAKILGYHQACLVSSEAALSVYKKIGFEVLEKNNTYIK